MNYNAFYDITPPTMEETNITTTNAFYEIIPPSVEGPDWMYVQDIRMQAAIERFASFDEYMEVPLPSLEEEEDDATVCYDDEVYRFHKCGEIDNCYDYSEFSDSETVVPENDDYFLPEVEDEFPGEPMDISEIDYRIEEDEDDYRNDPDYLAALRIERLMERF
jgi:hypothetical protein